LKGREDVDVRMLGDGRPFILEFINPKKPLSAAQQIGNMHKEIKSDSVYCSELAIVDRKFFDELKQIENSKAKSYCAVVWVKRRVTPKDLSKLNVLQNVKVYQKTPIRVLHRRSLMVREKVVYKMKAEFVNPHYFILHVLTSAGTYIKEFVHGDLSRTQPSIGSLLGSEADILQLDVTEVYDSVEDLDLESPDLFKVRLEDS